MACAAGGLFTCSACLACAAARAASSQPLHARTFSTLPVAGLVRECELLGAHALQNIFSQRRQWCLRRV